MSSWYAVHSKPRQERVARDNLQRQGYTTYLPMIVLRRLRRGRWVEVSEALFPRYLFIHADAGQQSLAPVRSTLGVAGLVRIGPLLRPVPDGVIAFLQRAEAAASAEEAPWPHQPGDEVQVLSGPFAGLRGVYRLPLGEQRAQVLIELLGRDNLVTLELDELAAG